MFFKSVNILAFLISFDVNTNIKNGIKANNNDKIISTKIKYK